MAHDIPWARRLVVCCDGTWQSSVSVKQSVPSNVTKLCRLIARIGTSPSSPSKKWHQIVYYDSGIGTGNLSRFEARRQGGTGAGLSENVIEAYNFIVMNYVPGDEIFCFGFSRGAYTARAVAGLVSDIGVIRPIDMHFFPEVYRAYMQNDEGMEFRDTQAWKWFVEGKLSKKGEKLKMQGVSFENDDLKFQTEVWEIPPHGELAVNPDSRKVKVVGVWDTVGSLGVPNLVGIDNADKRVKFGFHNVKLSQHIEHAYQALALDERRESFRPTLWYIPYEMTDNIPDLKQVWFPGAHINCGGGSDDSLKDMKGDLENISMASLTWMLQCISPHLTIDPVAYTALIEKQRHWLIRVRYACTYRHPSSIPLPQRFRNALPYVPFLNEAPSELAPPPRVAPHSHPDFDYGWGVGPLSDSFRGIYHLNGIHVRDPGHEAIEVYQRDKEEHVWTPLAKLGRTNEYIHPIVYHRMLVRGWDKHSPLKNGWVRLHRRLETDGRSRFWWCKVGEQGEAFVDGKVGKALPEWAILPESGRSGEKNYEREWYGLCEKTARTLKALGDAEDMEELDEEGNVDFLKSLDAKIDFQGAEMEAVSWP